MFMRSLGFGMKAPVLAAEPFLVKFRRTDRQNTICGLGPGVTLRFCSSRVIGATSDLENVNYHSRDQCWPSDQPLGKRCPYRPAK